MITLQKMIMGALIGGIFLFGFATDSLAQNGVGKTVSSVEVQLKINGNLYQGLQERIEYSVNRVGEKLLISQPVSLLESNKNTVRQTILNVYSKVLTGFRTDAVDLYLGEYTKIVIQLTPQAPLISKIDVGLEMNGVEPEIAEVVAGARIKVETEINRIFAGLPVEATTWADNIFDLVLDYLVERDFPGFKSDFTIVPGETSRIKLVLTPQKPLVSELAVQYSSASLPMWLVRVKNKERQAKLNLMKGLPVEFLLHYQPQVERYLSDFWNGFSEPGQMGFETRITVTAGERTRVDLNVQSQYFKTKLEARYFRGEKDTFANLQGYLGYQTNHAELYTRAYLGENPDGYYKVGFKVPFSQNFYGGYEYDLENHFKSFVFNYRFERGDYLELDLGLDGGLNKAVVGLAINPHFNLEIVNRDKNYGLQLMYHFW